MKFVPLSVMMEFGTPKWWTMSWKKAAACADFAVVTGFASIHFVNLSTATSRWVKPPGSLLRGPTMSSPQTAKGHVIGIVWSA